MPPVPNALEAKAVEQDQLSQAFSELDAALEPLTGRFSARSDYAHARNVAQARITDLDTYVRRSFPVDQRRQWNEKLEATKLPTWQQVKP